jgi:hypothetical protein
MKILSLIIIVCLSLSCSNELQVSSDRKSVVELINAEHKRKAGIKKSSSFQSYDELVYNMREKAVRLYRVETDTSKIKRFIVIDMVSYEGGKTIYGEIVINDTSKYFYKNTFSNKEVEKYEYPVDSETIILEHLKAHRFAELKALADEKGKTLSGSNFFYIGMYEKGMDSIYVSVLPGFIMN